MSTALPLFAQSMLIGLSIAAPVGQIGVLAIQRTLQHGAGAGIATGFGAAVADAVYGAIGAFGVSAVIAWLDSARTPLAAFGAVVIGVLAWRLWGQPPTLRDAGDAARPWVAQFASTFVLTLANPATIVSFVAVFGLLAARSATPASPWTMVAGVFTGSMLWWLVLAAGVARVRHRVDAAWQRRINRASALVLAGFALAGLVVAWPAR